MVSDTILPRSPALPTVRWIIAQHATAFRRTPDRFELEFRQRGLEEVSIGIPASFRVSGQCDNHRVSAEERVPCAKRVVPMA